MEGEAVGRSSLTSPHFSILNRSAHGYTVRPVALFLR